jgi:cysteinyl-tRNA synthetase
MLDLYLYNTLSRKKEIFQPINKNQVGLYTCGPTVYNFAHIGNLRTYLFEDFLKRVLEYNKYKVKHIMNITDVGHLTGDMDMGEDKMEKGAQREGKSAWQIAELYTEAFKEDIRLLNILEPSGYHKVTDNIPEQIALISKLEKKGYTYKTSDGIYFDTAKIKNYNKLSHLPLETLKEGARVEKNPEKKNPTDFALWKFSPIGAKRQMEWSSPWGVGFPGWHIECSAISLKYLGKNLDIHCGGADHINIHHTNEIAQSEAATGKTFFNYWLHGAFLNIVGGKKMAKSEDGFLTLKKALIDKGLNPLAYRFADCQVHYRKPMEYSEDNLRQAEQGLDKLWEQVATLGSVKGKIDLDLQEKFVKAVNDDLNIPKALAVLASIFKAKISSADKLATVLDFDKIFGFDLKNSVNYIKGEVSSSALPVKIQELAAARLKARLNKDWKESDKLRDDIKAAGYSIEDTAAGQKIKKN